MLKETQHTEFKPKFNEDVIETLVAFANTKGGRVLVGVDDSGKPLNTSWDAYPDNSHKLDDISLEKVEQAMEEMRKNGLTINETPISFLQKKDLLREGQLTNAAYLLFKINDSFLTTIELGRFQTPIIIKDTARTKADVLTEIEDVLTFVRKHTNKRMIFTGEARRLEKWQYPMEAIREIVINMIIHRDYRSTAETTDSFILHTKSFGQECCNAAR